MATVPHDMTCWEQTQTFAVTAATTVKDGAIEAGTWIAHGTVRVVEWLKDAWFVIQDVGINTAMWLKNSAVSAGRGIYQAAAKVYEAAFPYVVAVVETTKKYIMQGYTFTREFINAHPNETIVGIAAFAAGAFTAFLIQQFCCT